jgi:hypothetical protein
MCLGVPGKVTEHGDEDGVRMGTVDFGGITRKACLEYAPEADLGQRRFPSAEDGGCCDGEAGEETATRSAP